MSELLENYQSTAEKRYNQKGQTLVILGTGVSGDIFYVGDDEYIVDSRDGNPVVYDKETNERVHDSEIIDSIKAQIEQDKEILGARGKIAETLSFQNADKATILKWHMEFKGGEIDMPTMREGIDFYQVGRNSSHLFYIGVKDGKKFILSICPDSEWDEVNDEYVDFTEEDVWEVESWHGSYLGHF